MRSHAGKAFGMLLAIVVICGICPAIASAQDETLITGSMAAQEGESAQSGLTNVVKPTLEELRDAYAALPAHETIWSIEPDLDAYTVGTLSINAQRFSDQYLNLVRRSANLGPVTLIHQLNVNAAEGALILAKNNTMSPVPDVPEGLTEEQQAHALAGQYACMSSNISRVGYTDDPLKAVIQSQMDDDKENSELLGNRRRLLYPTITTTGIGAAQSASSHFYAAIRVLNSDENFKYLFGQEPSRNYGRIAYGGATFDYIAWPASGVFLSDLFPTSAAWSVSLNTSSVYAAPDIESVHVKLTRLSDNMSWTLDKDDNIPADALRTHTGEYFNVDNQAYGVPGCIIFTPGTANLGTDKYEGSYKVEITGLKTIGGEDAGITYQVDFAPARVSLESANVKISEIPAQTYTGEAITPEFEVTVDDETLVKGEDYAVKYEDNVDAGEAHITIAGKGIYEGAATTTFTIEPIPLDEAKVTGIENSTYEGVAHEPVPVVELSSKRLDAGKDFELTYANNVNAGTATVNIIGIGNYKGKIEKTFTIAPAPLIIEALYTTKEAGEEDPVLEAVLHSLVGADAEQYPELDSMEDGVFTYKVTGLNGGDIVFTITREAGENPTGDGSYEIAVEDISGPDQVNYEISVMPGEFVITGELLCNLESFAGFGRYDTARMIVEAELELSSYKGAIIVAGDDNKFPDALSASGLSGILDYPIVMVKGAYLRDENRRALDALKDANEGNDLDIVIVGGSAAVSEEVEGDLAEWGEVSARLDGVNRYETNALVYEYGQDKGEGWSSDVVFMATGAKFPDALAIAPYLVKSKAPIVLVNPKYESVFDLPGTSMDVVMGAEQIVALGGPDALSETILDEATYLSDGGKSMRLDGETRYQTGAKIVDWELEHGLKLEGAGIATGQKYPDALSSGFLLGKTNSVLCLASPIPERNAHMQAVLKKAKAAPGAMRVFGGESAVTPDMYDQIISATGHSGYKSLPRE